MIGFELIEMESKILNTTHYVDNEVVLNNCYNIEVYTDGSTGKNSEGKIGGGFAFGIVDYEKGISHFAGYKISSSNTFLTELMALKEALLFLKEDDIENQHIIIHCDNTSVCAGYKNLKRYNEIGFKNPLGNPIKFQDEWKELNEINTSLLEKGNVIKIEYIAAHVGHSMNEHVNDIAIRCRMK